MRLPIKYIEVGGFPFGVLISFATISTMGFDGRETNSLDQARKADRIQRRAPGTAAAGKTTAPFLSQAERDGPKSSQPFINILI